ncbi:MAG: DNA primase DnaG [Candidatus Undinarchaeales archaeon]|jgi:DNA primase|nr:DNA primase DnaG [Candidatus Undinarchaeales archaeon]MDP7492718.1 DNA primase DnaG [Candidatus Undinarchaeales archaeon]
MGKISPIAAKYIINAEIEVNGIVEKPDAVGAVFGQTEGLLGPDLELRELQRSGRIGRIEVTLKSRSGKSIGSITVPSSLDKSETAIIAAALETVDRIGPCTSKIAVGRIEDVRMAKRKYIVDRAKELLAQMMADILPDSQELSDEVKQAVRVEEIVDYGPERLPSGPNLLSSDDIIIVEGRADVINLLRQGIKNSLAVEGTNIPPSVIGLTKEKTATVFVDGDHGGELIIKELLHSGAEIDFITMAPTGKEVEELTKKEIHKCLRSRTPGEQYDAGIDNDDDRKSTRKPTPRRLPEKKEDEPAGGEDVDLAKEMLARADPKSIKKFKTMMEGLFGTRGALLLDKELNAVKRIPIIELRQSLNDAEGVFAVVFDGVVTKKLVDMAEEKDIAYLIGMKVVGLRTVPKKTVLLTPTELGGF